MPLGSSQNAQMCKFTDDQRCIVSNFGFIPLCVSFLKRLPETDTCIKPKLFPHHFCQQPVRMRFVWSRLFVGPGFTLVLPQKAISASSTKNLPPLLLSSSCLLPTSLHPPRALGRPYTQAKPQKEIHNTQTNNIKTLANDCNNLSLGKASEKSPVIF